MATCQHQLKSVRDLENATANLTINTTGFTVQSVNIRGIGNSVVNPNIAPGVAVFFYSTATLAGALIPVPGGLGVAEAMIQQQLVELGHVPTGDATAAMLLVRFATLWWAVLVGFLALALLRLRFPERLGTGEEGVRLDA